MGSFRSSLTRLARRPAVSQAPTYDGPTRVLAILGMHRSGTSSLAGSLEASGLDIGAVDTGNQWNEKGNRESHVLMRIHDDVLINSGGSWSSVPEHITWTAATRKRLERFIESRSKVPLWGFKDPRTILVIEHWLEVLPDLEMVATFRHPAAVARSLARRHGSDSPERWLSVWLDYSKPLLELCESRYVPLIDFGQPIDQYQQRLKDLITELRLPAPEAGNAFFDGSLRTPGAPKEMELPAEVERTHQRLVEIAADQTGASRVTTATTT